MNKGKSVCLRSGWRQGFGWGSEEMHTHTHSEGCEGPTGLTRLRLHSGETPKRFLAEME
jgi:hypothetical protein